MFDCIREHYCLYYSTCSIQRVLYRAVLVSALTLSLTSVGLARVLDFYRY